MKFLSRLSSTRDEKQLLNTPILCAMVFFLISLLLYSIDSPLPQEEKLFRIWILIAGILFLFFQYFVLIPFTSNHANLQWGLSILNGIVISYAITLEPLASQSLLSAVFIVTAVSSSAIIAGRRPSYILVCIVSISHVVYVNPAFFATDKIFWLEAISYPIMGFVITESILTLQKTIRNQVQRMKILNNVAQSLASSLEIHQVIALLSSAIQNALDAETYFVGLMDGENSVRLELFYDDGEFFPPISVPLENSLAGWAIENHTPVLLKDVLRDTNLMGIPFSIIGKQKVSQSWMGTLLESGGKILGIVAVASYTKAAFNNSDFELIKNVAQQASIAIENAYHHAEVEKQSTLDSLTGALNHGHFLKFLAREADTTRLSGTNLSLIMLDIDYFKLYNDSYGHLVGDQVLTSLTDIIRKHIKSTDLVGRWGGEEFVIALPNANGAQALEVAQRIKSSMNKLTLLDRDNAAIPAPSVSQGIAVFPKETDSIHTLIDLADQRLYIAKERGRNQIDPMPGFWDQKTLL